MAENTQLDPVEYLDRFFDELRNEVRSNPKLADRLVKALGAEVVFDTGSAADIANPYIMAAKSDKSRFYATFSPMKVSQIKRVLRDNNLATTVDMRGKSTAALIDMMYDRARSKVAERTSSFFKPS